MANAPRIAQFELSTPRILDAVLRVVRKRRPNLTGAFLDIGSGDGELIGLLRKNFRIESAACDYTDRIMKLPEQRVEIVDLNRDALPYIDGQFDLVTMTEVVEHIEEHRRIFREIFRVLKPGGLLIVTTPNLLNLKSRLRFLFFGFWNLFGPLPLRESRNYDTGGHINPLTFFYLAHALQEAKFKSLTVEVDRAQKSSLIPLIFLFPLIKLFGGLAFRQEVEKYATVDAHNSAIVRAMSSLPILLGRTIIVAATKP